MLVSPISAEAQQQERYPLPSEEYVPKTMPHILGTFGMTAILVIVLQAVSGAPSAVAGGPISLLYWLITGVVFFLPSVIVTAQLGVMYPYEGSLYNWTYRTLGRFWSFFVGLCSWFPLPLVIVGLAEEFVTFLQGLNSHWLADPWQQGLFILVFLAVTTWISIQRTQLVEYIIKALFSAGMVGFGLVALAGLIWVLTGRHVASDFTQVFHPQSINPGNYSFYGLIIFYYIGSNSALHMAGEIKHSRAITRHLLWSTIIVFFSYLACTTSILAVQGTSAGGNNFAMVTTVDMVFGNFIGDIAAICLMGFIIAGPLAYHCTFSRLLLAGGIDQRLPVGIARLNKDRVPANAIRFSAIIAAIFTVLAFLVVPYVIGGVSPVAVNTNVYFVSQASASVVWVISVLFLFLVLLLLFTRRKQEFAHKRLFPVPLLVICCCIGMVAMVLAIINTFAYSWIPSFIDNSHWWYICGGVTLACLIFAAMGSLFASSEADWQKW